MKTWEEFRKYRSVRDTNKPLDFYGCLLPDDDGKWTWFDSSDSFEIAVHWCCYAHEQFHLTTEEEMAWMCKEGCKQGYSIVHGTLLKEMYEKGMLK